MNHIEITFDRYNSLSKEVGKHNDIQSALKEAYELIKGVRKEKEKSKNNPGKLLELESLHHKFIKEYTELENEIRKSIRDDQNISILERKLIMNELVDIVSLAKNNGIKEDKSVWSTAGDWIRGTDTESSKKEAVEIIEMGVIIEKYFKKQNLNDTELLKLLAYSNNERKKLGEFKAGTDFGKFASLFGLDSSSADILYKQNEVIRTNQFQNDIARKIFGEGKEYNNDFILGYSNEKGNYLEKISDFENITLKKPLNQINSKALSNYFVYLDSTGKLIDKDGKPNTEYIGKIIPNDLLREIDITWKSYNGDYYARKILEERGILEKIKNILKISLEEAKKLENDLSPIFEGIEKINQKGDYEFYYKNQEYIPYIEDKKVLNSLINIFEKKGEQISFGLINKRINTGYLYNKNIVLSYLDIGNIDETELNDFDKLNKIIKNNIDIAPFILNKAVGLKVNKEIIKRIIDENNIKIRGNFGYINVYIGRLDEKIGVNDFNLIMKKSNNLESIDKLNKSEKEILTKYLIQNLNEENTRIIVKLINKGFKGENAEFMYLPVTDSKISEAIVRNEPSMIMIIPNNHLGDKNVIQAFLDGGKNDAKGISEKENKLQRLDLSNINRMLQVFDFFIKAQERINDNSIITKILLNNPILLSTVTNILRSEGNLTVDNEYNSTLDKFKKFISKANIIKYKSDFIEGKNTFDKNINGLEKNVELDNLSIKIEAELRNKKIEGKHISNILKIIKSGEDDNNIMLINLTSYIMENDLDSIIFNIIIKELNDYKTGQLVAIVRSIPAESLDPKFTKKENGKDSIDEEKILLDFEKYLSSKKEFLEGLSSNEKEKKINELKMIFINKNFSKLSEDDKKKIIAILRLKSEINDNNLKVENRDAYFEYVRSGQTNKQSFEDYAKEKNIQLKQGNNVEVGNKNIPNSIIKSDTYNYDINSGIADIILENGVSKIILTTEEQKLIKSNPESLDKIVDFFKTLNELGLSELWKEKEKIFTAISNKYGIGFNSKSDYLSENEIKIFLNSILKSVGKEKIDSTKSISEFKNIFSQKNDRQIIGSGYSDNLLQKGGSKISEQFLQKYILGKPYFDIDGFSKNI